MGREGGQERASNDEAGDRARGQVMSDLDFEWRAMRECDGVSVCSGKRTSLIVITFHE